MPKYSMDVERTYVDVETVEVEADTLQEAYAKARHEASQVELTSDVRKGWNDLVVIDYKEI